MRFVGLKIDKKVKASAKSPKRKKSVSAESEGGGAVCDE